MEINVIQLEVAVKGQINLDTDGFVYGVETAAPIFMQQIGRSNVEMVGMICLDHTNRILNYSNISIGNQEGVEVRLDQILRVALISNAAKFIIAHNHPSEILEITSNDIEVTKKIGKMASLMNIMLIDSLIVNARGDVISIREKMEEM